MDRSRQLRAVERNLRRSWPIRVVALLLGAQATALVGISLVSGARVNWREAAGGAFSPQALDVVVLGGMFIPCAVLALLAALGLLAGWRAGWLLAMFTEAIMLAGCLWLYLAERPGFIYPLMLCSIVAVLYLNSRDVRVAFHLRPLAEATEPAGET